MVYPQPAVPALDSLPPAARCCDWALVQLPSSNHSTVLWERKWADNNALQDVERIEQADTESSQAVEMVVSQDRVIKGQLSPNPARYANGILMLDVRLLLLEEDIRKCSGLPITSPIDLYSTWFLGFLGGK